MFSWWNKREETAAEISSLIDQQYICLEMVNLVLLAPNLALTSEEYIIYKKEDSQTPTHKYSRASVWIMEIGSRQV